MQKSLHSPLSQRVDLVDALRGFALLAIVLLHNLEHYNLFYFPDFYPDALKALDKGVWDTTWFMLAGKAFSTFSLLFGFSFFIQFDRAKQKGEPYGWRFAWRMLLLLGFAQLHALFYNGDILFMYAIVGLIVIPARYLSNKWLTIVAFILLLQPVEWGRMIYAALNPEYTLGSEMWSIYGARCKEVMANGNFLEIIRSNITDGQLYSNLWQVSAGRLFQIPALFLFGMLIGRLGYFVKSDKAVKFWVSVATWSFAAVVPLYIIKTYTPAIITNNAIKVPFETAVPSLWNFTFMTLLISCFSLLWFYKGNGFRFQRFIIPYGRMSLTNYITQSIIGCGIYLGWGFGLYKYTGATASFAIGLLIFGAQWLFSRWWLSTHKQGPLEWLWKKLTWIRRK